jgi:2-C-methyl-D-erythritol 4-phosphate cytidylyltransferase
MNSVWAILVAGGTGTRFGGQVPKQFLPLAGRRVIDYSLDVFAASPLLDGVVLVLPQDFVAEWKQALGKGDRSRIQVTAGGLTRQQSVQRGLQMVDSEAEWVLIHDVARPLVTEEILARTLAGAKETGAAVTSIPVADTLKKGNDRSYVHKTVSRDR